MGKPTMSEALIEAFQNEEVQEVLESVIAKVMSKSAPEPAKKSTPSKSKIDVETEVLKHIVFAAEDSETGVNKTVKEIIEEIIELDGNEDLTIRPRVFGKILQESAQFSKKTRVGMVYAVEAIVDDAEEYAKNLPVESEEVEQSEEEEALEAHKQLLYTALEDFESIDDLEDFLKGKSTSGLIKFINKYEMKIRANDKDSEKKIRKSIIEYLAEHIGEEEEEEENAEVKQIGEVEDIEQAAEDLEEEAQEESEEEEEEEKKSKKDKKSKKKDKKKDKKSKKDKKKKKKK